MGRLMGRNEGCFSYQLGHKNGQIVRGKDLGAGSWGLQPPLFAAPRPKPSVGTPAGRVQDQDQDQEDEQEIVRSPSQPILVIASHPLNGWIWFGEGLRGYDNWQRCAASDFKQNEHGETVIPLKTVAATTPKARAEEKLLRLI